MASTAPGPAATTSNWRRQPSNPGYTPDLPGPARLAWQVFFCGRGSTGLFGELIPARRVLEPDIARQDPRLSVLLDVQDPGSHGHSLIGRHEAEVIFHCSESLAHQIVDGWDLAASIDDLIDLPAGTAVARLPDMTVTLNVDSE